MPEMAREKGFDSMTRSCWWILVLSLALTACGSSSTTPQNCSSDKTWTGGNEESPLMNPGQDCIACHTSEGEGPKFQIAGTVMGAANDDDNCNGLVGVTVEITGSDGVVTTLTTNAAGNFFTDEHGGTPVKMPYTARVIGPGGKVSAMSAAQSTGACNLCHTATGANSAPGRIFVPK